MATCFHWIWNGCGDTDVYFSYCVDTFLLVDFQGYIGCVEHGDLSLLHMRWYAVDCWRDFKSV